jgi:hypothetical protein
MDKFFSAIGRIIMSIITLGTYKANAIADSNYTGSESGVRAGFAELRDQLIENYEQVISGVAGMEQLKSGYELRLAKLNEEEAELQKVMEGVISLLEKDPENKEALNDFNTFDARQEEIDKEQDDLSLSLGDVESKLEGKQVLLNGIQDEIAKLRNEEESAVADMALAGLEERLAKESMGLKKSIDRSGVDAIRDTISKKKATVRTLNRASGADTKNRMEKYKAGGEKSQSNAKLQKILAERAAAKKASDVTSGPKNKKKERNI